MQAGDDDERMSNYEWPKRQLHKMSNTKLIRQQHLTNCLRVLTALWGLEESYTPKELDEISSCFINNRSDSLLLLIKYRPFGNMEHPVTKQRWTKDNGDNDNYGNSTECSKPFLIFQKFKLLKLWLVFTACPVFCISLELTWTCGST